MRALSPLARTSFRFHMMESAMNSMSSISIFGSRSPVGRIICSATTSERESSYSAGVAETQTAWKTFFKFQRTVFHCRRKPETESDEIFLS